MRRNFLATLLVLGLISPHAAPESNEEGQYLEVSLYVDGKKETDTWIRWKSFSEFTFPEPAILLALSRILPQSQISRLTGSINSGGIMSNTFLQKYGIGVRFDPGEKRLYLQTRPATTKPRTPPARDTFETKVVEAVMESSKPLAVKPIPVEKMDPGPPPEKSAVDTAAKSGMIPEKAVPNGKGTIPLSETRTLSPTMTREELFQKVFKTQAPKLPDRLEVELKVDNMPKGKIWLMPLKGNSTYQVPASKLIAVLRSDLSPENLEKIGKKANQDGWIEDTGLTQTGILSRFHMNRFLLEIEIPSSMVHIRQHALTRLSTLGDTAGALLPNGISGYLNLHARQQFAYSQVASNARDTTGLVASSVQSENRRQRRPVHARFNSGLNLHGLVLEGDGSFREQENLSDSYFEREDLRLVYDHQKTALRYSVGDLLYNPIGFQNFLPIGGISVQREFSMQPDKIAYPTREFEFFLEEEAEVKVFVNGNLVAKLDLPPGTHNLENFPLSNGESRIHIEILDASGRQQEVEFNFITDPSLLRPGLSQFSLNAGFPSARYQERVFWDMANDRANFLGYEYEYGRPVVSASYTCGLTQQWTGGGFLQTADRDALGGLETLHAFKVGKVISDMALSYRDSTGRLGMAIKSAYSSVPPAFQKKRDFTWMVQGIYRSDDYREIGVTHDLLRSWEFTAAGNKALDIATVAFGAGYQVNRGRENSFNVYGNLRKRWANGLMGGVSANHYLNETSLSNTTVSVSLLYSFNVQKHSFMANHRSATNAAPEVAYKSQRWENFTDLFWEYNTSAPFPSNPTGFLNASISPLYSDYNGRLNYRGNQGLLEINGRRTEPGFPEIGRITRNYADVIAKTSLVMVDGKFAFSRPVQNSFVMIDGVKGLDNTVMELNPHTSGYDARSNFAGPAVLPDLGAYSTRNVRVEPVNPPMGAQIKQSSFLLYPTYKSGFLISLGSDEVIMVMGTLKNEKGDFLEFQSLKLTPMGKVQGKTTYSFTNASGRFLAGPISSGEWRIEGQEGLIYEFVVPEKVQGLHPLGELKPIPSP